MEVCLTCMKGGGNESRGKEKDREDHRASLRAIGACEEKGRERPSMSCHFVHSGKRRKRGEEEPRGKGGKKKDIRAVVSSGREWGGGQGGCI